MSFCLFQEWQKHLLKFVPSHSNVCGSQSPRMPGEGIWKEREGREVMDGQDVPCLLPTPPSHALPPPRCPGGHQRRWVPGRQSQGGSGCVSLLQDR